MKTTIKWAAELSHVREVSLVGIADLQFWRKRLMPEGLRPAEHGGEAQILVTSAAGRFRGVGFRELSFCVMVLLAEHATPGAFLIGAFNSSRVFAFCERVFFSTPYEYGDVRISTASPASIDLFQRGKILFRASIGASRSRQPAVVENGGWEGPVLLPSGGKDSRNGKLFFARIQGRTHAYPVMADDLITIDAASGDRVLGAIRESGFVAKEWHIREDADHARSKTYRRDTISQ